MVRVTNIKPAKKGIYRCDCLKCSRVLEYHEKDILQEIDVCGCVDRFIKCPVCKGRVRISIDFCSQNY